MKENPAKAMPLVSHFIELRKRLFKSAIAIAIASFIGWFLYEVIINKLASPICDLKAATESGASDCGILYINGVLGRQDSLIYGDEFYWK